MSFSTLPELFKTDLMRVKTIPKKVGGRFSIDLITRDDLISAQSNVFPKKKTSCITQRDVSTALSTRRSRDTQKRSQSIKKVPKTYFKNQDNPDSLFFQVRSKRDSCDSVGFKESQIVSKRVPSALSKDGSLFHEIFFKNKVRNDTQFSYAGSNVRKGTLVTSQETIRNMNGCRINQQEGDTFKNKAQTMGENLEQIQNTLQTLKVELCDSSKGFKNLEYRVENDLKNLELNLKRQCQELSKSVSYHRRKTNEETRKNVTNLKKLAEEFKDTTSVLIVLNQKGDEMQKHCLSDDSTVGINVMAYKFTDGDAFSGRQVGEHVFENIKEDEEENFERKVATSQGNRENSQYLAKRPGTTREHDSYLFDLKRQAQTQPQRLNSFSGSQDEDSFDVEM